MCPTINKLPKKEKKTPAKISDHKQLRAIAYRDTKWRKERDLFIHEHPICHDCLEKGKVTPATSVHHIKSPFQNGEINWTLLYDWDNLMPLCHECHGLRHAKEQGHISPEEIIRQLDELFDENKPDSDFE